MADLLDRMAASEMLGISMSTLDRYLMDYRRSAGRVGIPHARLSGRCVRIRRVDLDQWVSGQVSATAAGANGSRRPAA